MNRLKKSEVSVTKNQKANKIPRFCYQPSLVASSTAMYFNFLFIVTPIVGVCDCSMFCCMLLYVHSSIAIILMGKRELVALLLSSWCLVMVERLFLAVPWGCLRFVIVVFPDHTHLLFMKALSLRPRLLRRELFTMITRERS